jgi:hypothetical protein
MYFQRHLLDLAVFYLTMSYITFLLKETKSGWNISSKHILYAATALTFIFSGLLIGFAVMLGYIIFSVIFLVVFLPYIRVLIKQWLTIRKFLNKRRNR